MFPHFPVKCEFSFLWTYRIKFYAFSGIDNFSIISNFQFFDIDNFADNLTNANLSAFNNFFLIYRWPLLRTPLFWEDDDQDWGCAMRMLDHDDPSKPSHRLTNGPKPSKTIESDGSKTKNHWKTIDCNGQTTKKHSMVMVASKTIENFQWSPKNHWKFPMVS